jgi:sugar O-acyltransferase (sialic acid O-acetyltransferase NeuD family)
MSLIPLVLVGGGGHASDVLQAIEVCNAAAPTYTVVGILADTEVDGRRFVGRGVEHIGTVGDVASIDARYVLCLGWPWGREALAARLAGVAEPAAPIVHPSADVGIGVELGLGSVVLGQAHLSPMVRLGRHSLVSYTASIGHDAKFGDTASVMPGANVSGDVLAGHGVLVGTGASVNEGLRLGNRSRVGAGAVVVADVAAAVTVAGVPAREIT